jgi:glycosyltransferase involved in cell wall biosynthesis
MKIVHVISGLTKGGGERVAAELANKAAEKGDEVTILAAWPVNPEFLQNSVSHEVEIKFVSETNSFAYLKIIPWIFKNKNWLANADVLHCHLSYGAVFGAMAKIILRKILRKNNPVIIETNHAVGMPVPKINRWMHSKLIMMKDGLVLMAKDPYWTAFIEQHPRLANDFILNGIALQVPEKNEEKKYQFKKELGIPQQSKYLIGTVSMLRPDRKPDLYIPICKDIYQKLGNDAHFILGGDGIEFEKIKLLAVENKLADIVHMPGLVKVAAEMIGNLDVYVSISVGYATGISMIEAAMCKVPVVGIQLTQDYVSTDEDWVWSHTDLNKVAERIIFLLENEPERKALAEKQFKYANEHFTADAMHASYDAFYKKVISKVN